MFTVTALPASYGDCLWVEYGDPHAPNVILIDAGPSAPAILKEKLLALAVRGGFLELVVVTHVDADHIAGMLALLENDFYGVPVRDFWFNGFRHLPGPETFGEKQGERLTELLLNKNVPWNAELHNAALLVGDGQPRKVQLPGGASISLLSPDAELLTRLKKKWIQVCGEADLYADLPAVTTYFGEPDENREAFGTKLPNIDELAGSKFNEDDAEANGSSIAFELAYAGKRVLCGADAYPSRLLASLQALYGEGPYAFDLVKLPHHGSENNVSLEFISSLYCPRYLFSTNGAKFKHPTPAAVARVIKYGAGPELIFNYRSDYTAIWNNELLPMAYPYTVTYGDGSITVDLT